MGFGGSGGGSSSLSSATDVALNNPAANEVLTYDNTTQKWSNAASQGGGALSVDDLPAGSVVYARYNTNTSTWPARPTSRNDIMVHWIGADEANAPPDALSGVDFWDWIGS